MELYLVRHGIAVERGSAGYEKKDAERPLTSEGRKKMELNARGMRRMGVSFEQLLSSPYPRALQTAQIVAKVFKAVPLLHYSRKLTAEASPIKLIPELRRLFSRYEAVMIVGHEPFLSVLAGILLTGKETSFLDFKKGAILKLTGPFRPGRATLEYLLTPFQLRRLAR